MWVRSFPLHQRAARPRWDQDDILAAMGARISIMIALACAIATPARAQSPEAEAVFREGKKLIKEGKLAEGCAKLEASDRIETSTGTLLNLGDCREQNHQLAS